jgi:hypothetical protein
VYRLSVGEREREGGKEGGMEVGRDGGMEGWRDGGMEGWRAGGREVGDRLVGMDDTDGGCRAEFSDYNVLSYYNVFSY